MKEAQKRTCGRPQVAGRAINTAVPRECQRSAVEHKRTRAVPHTPRIAPPLRWMGRKMKIKGGVHAYRNVWMDRDRKSVNKKRDISTELQNTTVGTILSPVTLMHSTANQRERASRTQIRIACVRACLQVWLRACAPEDVRNKGTGNRNEGTDIRNKGTGNRKKGSAPRERACALRRPGVPPSAPEHTPQPQEDHLSPIEHPLSTVKVTTSV
jgi:hypothetical protein